MESADEAAREQGLSRSGLIAEALRSYLGNRRKEKIRNQLNAVYGEASALRQDSIVPKLKRKMRIEDAW